MKPAYLTIAGLFLAIGPAAAEQFSINDALRQAVQTNPGVGEASANRRATESDSAGTGSRVCRRREVAGHQNHRACRDQCEAESRRP